MTNEEAKQEAIRKAYGEFYKTHRFNMDANGWCGLGVNRLTYNRQIEYHPVHSKLWRPITLNGIENNNGWTRIEPDGSNLPKHGDKSAMYEICIFSNGRYQILSNTYTALQLAMRFKAYTNVTHFRQYIKPEIPLW